MSAIHIHNWATSPPVATTPGTETASTTSPTTSTIEADNSPTTPYLHSLTLTPASTILPPAALAQKATSSKTVCNNAKPVIKQQGPDTVEIPPSDTASPSSSSPSHKKKKKTHTKSKLKNGYIPKGYTLNADGTFVSTVAEGTGTRYHTTETSMSTTSEELEDGGTRTVWVRTERHITVLIQGVKAATSDEDEVTGGISALRARRMARSIA